MNLSTKVKKISILTSVLSIILIITFLWVFIYHMSYIKFNKEAQILREEYYSEQRELIKDEIYRVHDFIEYYKSKTEERLKKEIKDRVYEGFSVVENIHQNNKDKTFVEIEEMIKDALRNVRFNNGNGYYFVYRLDGTNILNSVDPNVEGHNLLNLQNGDGVYVLKDISEYVKTYQEGFYEYTWTKPDVTGNKYRKISFVKYFEPLDIFIGTGLYIDDVEEIIKEEVLDRISQIRYRNDGYIFVTTYDGTALVFAQKELRGKDISIIEDVNGVQIHNEEKKVISKYGEGYVKYFWSKPNEKGVYPKLTFVKGIDDWNWILGTGIYLDEIEETIKSNKEQLLKEIKTTVFRISVIVMLVGLLVTFIQLVLLRWSEKAMKEEEKIYEILTNLSEDGIFILDSNGKIIESNQKGLEMISYSMNEVIKLNFNNLINDSLFNGRITEISTETYLKDINEFSIPIELHVKGIELNRRKKFIAYVRDLTKRRLYEDSLKHKAITDDLTGVYNRGFIMTQLKSEIEIVEETENSTSLVLLDIDKFKALNDSYGHLFGDKVLKELCRIFKSNLRNTDFIGRYGGEEFIIILPNTDKSLALKIIKRINNSFKNLIWKEDEKLKITFSAGIVQISTDTISKKTSDYIEEVDKLLYKAKEYGRNRIEIN